MVTQNAMTVSAARRARPVGPRDTRGYRVFQVVNAVVLLLVVRR